MPVGWIDVPGLAGGLDLQEEAAGRYEILGRRGHFSLRAINKNIPGLHVDLPYGKEGYYDDKNVNEKFELI